MNNNTEPRLNKVKKPLLPRPDRISQNDLEIEKEFSDIFLTNVYRVRSLKITLVVFGCLIEKGKIRTSSKVSEILEQIEREWLNARNIKEAHPFRLARVIILEICVFRRVLSLSSYYPDIVWIVNKELKACGSDRMPDLHFLY